MNEIQCPRDVCLLDVPDEVFPVAWSSELVIEKGWHDVSVLLGLANDKDCVVELSNRFDVSLEEIDDRIGALRKAYPEISTLIDNSPSSIEEFVARYAHEQSATLPQISRE